MKLRATRKLCGSTRKTPIVTQRNKPLGQADRFHVSACSGWLGLGDVDSAIEELEQISPKRRTHPEVLMARCEVFHAAKRWKDLLPIAETLLQQLPKLDFVWINRSYALHELKRTQEAFDALLPAAEKFPKRWIIRYNLGCYCAQLGRLEEAMHWLKQAVALADKQEIKAMSLRDNDFEPLWQAIREL
jgi:tetratricopeptide (TPR) repeat protein